MSNYIAYERAEMVSIQSDYYREDGVAWDYITEHPDEFPEYDEDKPQAHDEGDFKPHSTYCDCSECI